MPGNMRGFKTRDEKVQGLKEYVIYWLKNRVCWVRANRRGRVGPHIACCSFNRRRLEDNALLENRSLAESKWQLDGGTIWGINTVEARLDPGADRPTPVTQINYFFPWSRRLLTFTTGD